MNLLNRTYENKVALVTGDTGFKGAWLIHWLKMLGAQVIGLALPAEDDSLFRVTKAEGLIRHIDADLCNFDRTREIVEDVNPDFIFHLAAQSLVRESYDIPRETYMTNVAGTLNLLEAIRVRNKPCSVVIVTTDKCYENSEWVYAYRENDPMGGYDPYSSSKGCVEILTSSYRRSFFEDGSIRCASARAGNVIGPGDFAKDRIVPDIIRAIFANQTLSIRSPNSIRPWQHVLEPLSGYLTLGAHIAGESGAKYCQAYNFGPRPESAQSVLTIVETIAGFSDVELNFAVTNASSLHEAQYLKLAIDRAVAELSWAPVWGFAETLNHTWAGYRDIHADSNNATTYVNNEIQKYMQDAQALSLPWAQA